MNALFFWLFSGGMIVCALAVVLNRNAVASALCFTFSIVFMSGLFVMLSAFFLAAVQILVTAGAVMVLFLFIIMLLDLTAMEHMPAAKNLDGMHPPVRARLSPDRRQDARGHTAGIRHAKFPQNPGPACRRSADGHR